MEGSSRRIRIVELLREQKGPVSGTALSNYFHVSRQVIVQDMALLRAEGRSIFATNRGYLLLEQGEKDGNVIRNFHVCHEKEQILEELYLIVDLGGRVLDVSVDHDIYGRITAPLIIRNRSDAKEFVERSGLMQTKPLTSLTDGVHYHLVEADDEAVLERVSQALAKAGFLITESDR